MIDICKFADIASAPFAGGAAVLWLLSATVKTPNSFSVDVVSVHTGDPEFPSGQVVAKGYGTSDDLTALGAALIKQSGLSKWAAGCAAIAAALQGIAAIWAHQISN